MDYLKYNDQYANSIIELLNQQYFMPYSNFEVNGMINKVVKKLTNLLHQIQSNSDFIISNSDKIQKLIKYTNSLCVVVDSYIKKYTGLGPKTHHVDCSSSKNIQDVIDKLNNLCKVALEIFKDNDVLNRSLLDLSEKIISVFKSLGKSPPTNVTKLYDKTFDEANKAKVGFAAAGTDNSPIATKAAKIALYIIVFSVLGLR